MLIVNSTVWLPDLLLVLGAAVLLRGLRRLSRRAPDKWPSASEKLVADVAFIATNLLLRGDLSLPGSDRLLVRGRLLHVIDHQYVDRSSHRFQFQPELFLQGCEDGNA